MMKMTKRSMDGRAGRRCDAVLQVLLTRRHLLICSGCVLVLPIFAMIQLHLMSYGIYKNIELLDNNNYTETEWKNLFMNASLLARNIHSNAYLMNTLNQSDITYKIVSKFQGHPTQSNPTQSHMTNIFFNSKFNLIRVGIMIPSSTRNVSNPSLEKLSLTTICLPSIYKTTESNYLYKIYIGIDEGDYLESVQNDLKTLFTNVTIVLSYGKTFTHSVNAMSRQGYEDGMDYLVRINDDTTFETQGWTSLGIAVLKHYKPPNIGVVGPTCKEGNTRILTHDMVHRTHFDIFGFYYPTYFDNWYTDDWITDVYKPGRSTKLSNWTVVHHVHKNGRRYMADIKKQAQLKKIVTFGKRKLANYLQGYTIKH